MIEVRDLGFRFDGGPRVFESLQFSIDSGRTVAVLGANGTGKTTFLRLLAGLLEPTSGEIRIDSGGDPIVGLAPEIPADGLFARTVEDEIAFFPKNRGLSVPAKVNAALKTFEIEDLGSRDPYSLSEGEKRLVTIAAVLAGDPDVIALDEPTGGLDRDGWTRLGERLATVDRTVVMVTHDTDFAWRYADAVVVLSESGVVTQGSTRSVLADPSFDPETIGLDLPSAVRWARDRGIDEPPATVANALDRLEESS